ncbi:hypothetical protein GMES_2106 [Paraglaciecola mesophila KMM 241]|uniref:Molybdenum cofactor biosynthesis protein B n=1 Tax=Paraglaciecola mesophila KMM 241 TaxID=1128912 RepID=K6Z1Y7_9ALTE|nr:hypothetical protein GMES_2106 [Paraglaciecola mesophila KMM 241]
MGHSSLVFAPLQIAVLTVSDTRNESTDTSGEYLRLSATEADHIVVDEKNSHR